MKKFVVFLIILITSFLLVACGMNVILEPPNDISPDNQLEYDNYPTQGYYYSVDEPLIVNTFII